MKYLVFLMLLAGCASFSPNQARSVFPVVGFSGGGTGFLVQAPSGRSYVLTNAHVCESAFFIQENGRTLPAKQLEVADYTDLCLIKAPAGLSLPSLKIAAQEPAAHDRIHIIGYGLLLGSTLTEGNWVGHIREQILSVYNPSYVTAQVLPGNSGSPVLNDDGEVVGVVYASSPGILNRALVVPLDDIKEFLKDY